MAPFDQPIADVRRLKTGTEAQLTRISSNRSQTVCKYKPVVSMQNSVSNFSVTDRRHMPGEETRSVRQGVQSEDVHAVGVYADSDGDSVRRRFQRCRTNLSETEDEEKLILKRLVVDWSSNVE